MTVMRSRPASTAGPLAPSMLDALLEDCHELSTLDWQHLAYRFVPANQALTWQVEWKIPIYPDGDYFAFLSEDYAEGTFGHPWEQTICVMGERLIDSLAQTWATWLPVKRQNGLAAL